MLPFRCSLLADSISNDVRTPLVTIPTRLSSACVMLMSIVFDIQTLPLFLVTADPRDGSLRWPDTLTAQSCRIARRSRSLLRRQITGDHAAPHGCGAHAHRGLNRSLGRCATPYRLQPVVSLNPVRPATASQQHRVGLP